jgi:hypothetical protein
VKGSKPIERDDIYLTFPDPPISLKNLIALLQSIINDATFTKRT